MPSKEPNGETMSKSQQLQEELQEQYLKSLDELEVGQLVSGHVIQVTPEFVFVDIGYKSEGKIPVDEFDELPEVGGEVEVVLARMEPLVVSKRKADERVFWKKIKQAFTDREPVEGKVARSVKGGFEIRMPGGIKGFNPISKMDLHRIDNPEEYVGMTSKFYVERLYSDNRVNIILSRRNWLEEEVQRKKNEFFLHVHVGDNVQGAVKSFTSFGAFIDLGGFDGLLHINDMSWGHVTRPKDYVKKGQTLTLKVVRLDHENQKINLSLKDMTENPWDSFEDRYKIDQVVKGKVTKLTDFGAFIEIEGGIEGLAHISEMSWVKRISHPSEVLNIGDDVDVMILDYDLHEGKVSLGLKQVQPNPWDDMVEKYTPGMRMTKKVKKITNSGAFIELEEGIDAFLHVDDLSWTKKYKNPGAVLTEGEEIECMVTQIDPETHNIRVGLKQLEEDPWKSLKTAYGEGSIISGEVTNVTDFGVFVRVQGGIEGLINKSQLIDPRQGTFEEALTKYNVGDKLDAVITELSPGRQKLSLSIRELERKRQQKEMQKYIHDDSNEGTVTLGDLLKKNESEE
ncbi:30S ribosomal protein S1 [Spirochaeta africana]|uniref:30S ribosomal protein S1 n=1 Tax=Spirochaeta africana (strain ATCC 700263 / DSM 8902 / Z-7692) TaxID=889378 RepID=H9UJ81_SPIAZ|nr:30S ribosomal protein S1 [Spirochaeta africana]AFG37574.1 ribosomal protein S1 [Spirochaeta africana DSM 8902]